MENNIKQPFADVPRHHFKHVESTMDTAHHLYKKGHALPFCVSADTQSQGRGRLGRGWVSPFGNVYLNVVTQVQQNALHMLPCALSLCIKEALESAHTPKDDTSKCTSICFKWPNDILLNHKKVAGVLVEVLDTQGSTCVLSIGIGINTTHTPVAPESLFPPTHCAQEGWIIHQEHLMKTLAQSVAWIARRLSPHAWESMRQSWLENAYRGPLVVQQGSRTVSGVLETLTKEGHSVIRDAQGTLHTFAAGDVSFLNSPSFKA